ncbi:MAG: hypothetical protein U0175_09130 [Caldilineaceae bacterium]
MALCRGVPLRSPLGTGKRMPLQMCHLYLRCLLDDNQPAATIRLYEL